MDYENRDNCRIVRGENTKHFCGQGRGLALLIGPEDEILYRFPEAWADDQIWRALDFANVAFHKGIDAGVLIARQQIKLCLGIKESNE